MEKISNCNQCFNFCPIENVRCEKGRALRDSLEEKEVKEKEGLEDKAGHNKK